jgi:hypothetical protein
MLRRNSEDHPVVGLTPHFERPLREDVEYYNCNLTHMALQRNAPLPRAPADAPAEELVGTAVLGGLHHTYRAAA